MAEFADPTYSHISYATFRPSYPTSLYDTVMAHHQGPKKLCIDLGCGPGIATRELSKRFERVLGVDPSAGMIKQAQQQSVDEEILNCEYRQGAAENLSFIRDGEADCIFAAEAAHWSDFSRLWLEMQRVVRHGGTMAFFSYKDPVFVDCFKAFETMHAFQYDPHGFGPYWNMPGEAYLQDNLGIVQPPVEDWTSVERIEYEPGSTGKHSGKGTLFLEARTSVGQVKQYARTWSSYHKWKEATPDRTTRSKQQGVVKGDVMDDMFDAIAKVEPHFRDDNSSIDVEYGSILIMARRR